MKIDRIIWCEGPDCEMHQSTATPAPYLPTGWIAVAEWVQGSADEFAFCGWDCVLKKAAQIPPPEIIPWENHG